MSYKRFGFNRVLSIRQKQWLSIIFGVFLPIIVDYIADEVFHINTGLVGILILVVELLSPSLIVYYLWNEIGYHQNISQKDLLTHLFNRRGANEALIMEVKQTQNELVGKTISFPYFGLIAFDVDNFKRVNDTFGHEAGDTVLVIMADIMKTVFKRQKRSRREQSRLEEQPSRRKQLGVDIACRMGGDEFAIILSNTTPEVTFDLAEIFCKSVANDNRLHFETFNVAITVSVGVAPIKIFQTSSDEDIEAALHNAIIEADQFIYSSKRNGRNSVSGEPTRLMPIR